ncbi:MAG: glycosyltransferase [Thermoanaerobaculia bacterium]|nr:glycosyltransferase [Thermoanaerobaculia bacterium]
MDGPDRTVDEAALFELVEAGRPADALAQVDACLGEDPDNTALVELKAALLRSAGSWREAGRVLAEARGRWPDDLRLRKAVIDIAADDGFVEEALALCREALALAPDDPWLRFRLVEALGRLDRDEECAAAIREDLAAPQRQVSQRALRLLARLEGEVRGQWDRLLELDVGPTAVLGLRALVAVAHARRGDLRQATDLVAAGSDPAELDDGELFALAAVRQAAGNADGALAALNLMLARHCLTPLTSTHPDGRLDPRHLSSAVERHVADGPLVTVLMTSHRWHPNSHAAIGSVLAQSWRNLELIVVDDHSDSECERRLSEAARRDSRMRLRRLPARSGTYVAKNVGLGMARGELIAFMDSDDWSHPQKLERQVEILESTGRIATIGRRMRISDSGDLVVGSGFQLTPLSLMIRRRPVLDRLGFFDSVRVSADTELHRRLEATFGEESVVAWDAALLFMAAHADSLTGGGPFAITWRGLGPVRLRYRAGFRQWHRRIRVRGEDPRVAFPPTRRPFPAPEPYLVRPEALQALSDSCEPEDLSAADRS